MVIKTVRLTSKRQATLPFRNDNAFGGAAYHFDGFHLTEIDTLFTAGAGILIHYCLMWSSIK
jgi:hypothetical protein